MVRSMSAVVLALSLAAVPAAGQGASGGCGGMAGPASGAGGCACMATSAGGPAHQHGAAAAATPAPAGESCSQEGMRPGVPRSQHPMPAGTDSLDARLDSLATLLRTAKGERRLAAIADALALLVDHQREMRRGTAGTKMEGGHGGGAMQCPKMRSDSSQAGGGAHNH